MNRLLISALSLLLYQTTATAQQFFTRGYAVTTQDDTLQGEIRQKGSKVILLRTSSTSVEQSYTPSQIQSYVIEGVNYVAALLTEDGTTNRLFLREGIKGYVKLYSLNSPDGELAYVLQLPNGSFMPLRGKQAWLVLNRNLTECNDPTFLAKLDSHHYVYYAYFERIITDYNRCVKPEIAIRQIKSPFHYEAGALLGLAHNRWNYSFDMANLYVNPNGLYSVYYTFAAGGFLTIMPHKRLSLTLEALFTQYKGERTSILTNPIDPTVQGYRHYAFQEQFLGLPIIARYILLDRSVRWYIKGGVGFTYSFTLTGQTGGNNLVDSDLFMRPGISFGYVLGVGADIPLSTKRRFSAEIRIMPHIIKDGPTHIGDFRSTQLMLAVPLVKH